MRVETTIRFLMVCLALLGQGALCLHKATHHCDCSVDLAPASAEFDSSACTSCCSAECCGRERQNSEDNLPQLVQVCDDCLVCCNLAHAGEVPIRDEDRSFHLLSSVYDGVELSSLHVVQLSNAPRGPPRLFSI